MEEISVMNRKSENDCFANRLIPLAKVIPGMILGTSIIIKEQFYLPGGTVLDKSLLQRLHKLGIKTVAIRRPLEVMPKYELTADDKKFIATYHNTSLTVQHAFEHVRYFQQLPLQKMQEMADESLNNFVQKSNAISLLQLVRCQDEYTFQHSLNVSILAGVIGRWLNYKGEELRQLVLSGLLHDIGKSKIPLPILNKPAALSKTEMFMMQQHTIFGSDLLKTADLSPLVFLTALQHHERRDGSGYPFRIPWAQVHIHARIIAIADLYDAMTSNRVYQKKQTPFVVAEVIMQEMFTKLDPSICMIFLENLSNYLLGGTVYLSNGLEAEVVFIDKLSKSRIVVRTNDNNFIHLDNRKNKSKNSKYESLKIIDFTNN